MLNTSEDTLDKKSNMLDEARDHITYFEDALGDIMSAFDELPFEKEGKSMFMLEMKFKELRLFIIDCILCSLETANKKTTSKPN